MLHGPTPAALQQRGLVSRRGFKELHAGRAKELGDALRQNQNRISIVIPELVKTSALVSISPAAQAGTNIDPWLMPQKQNGAPALGVLVCSSRTQLTLNHFVGKNWRTLRR
jgi:hypothetical protein